MTPQAVPPIAIVVSRYNGGVTSRLLEGAQEAYARRGGDAAHLGVIEAPGAFELVALSLAAARGGVWAGVLAIGCIVRGETSHDRVLADAVAGGLVDVTVATGVPVSFGVLTVDNNDQALARAGGGQGNKGEEGMEALLDTLSAMDAIEQARVKGKPGGVQSTLFRTIAKLGGAGEA